MDRLIWQLGKLRNPFANIGALRIKSLPLAHRVKYAEKRGGVRSRPRDPLPTARITGRIGIHKRVPKPSLANAPVDEKMLDEKRRDDHANAIMHPSCRPKLAHTGIDDRIARLAGSPNLHLQGIVAPRKSVERRLQVGVGHLRMQGQDIIVELTPAYFRQIFVSARTEARRTGPGLFHSAIDLVRSDFAPGQMWRKPRRTLHPGDIAPFGIVAKDRLDHLVQPRLRPGFARRPDIKSNGPIRLGRVQLPVGQAVRLRPGKGRTKYSRRRREADRVDLTTCSTPKRRENGVKISSPRSHPAGLQQKAGIERRCSDSSRFEGEREGGVALLHCRLINFAPENLSRISLKSQGAEDFRRIAAT